MVNVYGRLWATVTRFVHCNLDHSHYGLRHRSTPSPTASSAPPLAQPTQTSSQYHQTMSVHTITRAASSQTNNYASRRWSAAQIVAGLRRMVAFGDSERAAVAHVNSHTQPDDQHALSSSSLKRMYNALPACLRHPATSSEGQLLEHVQTY